MPEKVEHGTYAGSQWHARTGTPICAACKKARARYMRDWRKTEAGRRQVRRESIVRRGAVNDLINRHPEEFNKLLHTWREKTP